MEGALILLGVVVLAGPWFLAVAAWVRTGRLARRVEDLEGGAAPRVRAAPHQRVQDPAQAEPVAAEARAPGPHPEPEPEPEREREVPLAARETLGDAARARPPDAPPGSLEERLALVWLTRIGALVLLLGAATAFKWAVDNEWIGPAGRVALGALAAAATLALGEALRARTRPAWVNAIQGAGLALLDLSIFAAAALYQLVPFWAAFAALAVVAALGAGLALRGKSELVLGLSLLGGLAAPVLLSTGVDNPGGLLGWLLLISGTALAVSAHLGFRLVPALALVGTAVLFGGWLDRYFQIWPPPLELDAHRPAAAQQGAYFALSPRLVPLALVLAHLAAWLLTWSRARRPGPLAWPWRFADAWLAVALLLLHLGPFLLLRDRPLEAGAAVALAGMLSAELARRAGRALLHPLAAALGGLLLATAVGQEAGWLLAAALWAGAHLLMAGRTLLVARAGSAPEAPQASPVVAAAIAGLGFAGLAVAATGPDQGLLRAALAGAGGVAELALGAATLPRGRGRATVLLGASLGLVAAAAGFLLSGAGLTLAWAVLAATVALAAAQARDRFWLVGAVVLFALALGRALGLDLQAPTQARLLFLSTDGARGALLPTLLLNARGGALAGVGVALLAAARWVQRPGGGWRTAAGALVVGAHAALLALAVTEVRDALLQLPVPVPPRGDSLAFEEYRRVLWAAVEDQRPVLDTVTTVVLGLYAAVLVAVGFLAREVLHRWLGLALFAATLLKVLLSDVWRLSSGQRILVFMASGLLMLAAGFLYARHGSRIRGLLAAPPPGSGRALALVGAGLCWAAGVGPGLARAEAPERTLDGTPFQSARSVAGVERPGLYAVRVDAPLWQASLALPGRLSDVRLAGPTGAEVGWALRRVGSPEPTQEVPVVLVDPVVLPDGSERVVVDKGRAGLRTDELRLELGGDDYLRRVRVESSDDGRQFGVLVDGPRVYAVPGLTGARRTTVLHPPSEARWLRVTLLAGAGGQPGLGAVHAVRRPSVPAEVDALQRPAPPRTPGPGGRSSVYELDLGAPGVPLSTVALTLDSPAFERRVRVLGSEDGSTYATLGEGLVFRVAGDEQLRVAVTPVGRRWLRLEVEDGDAAPLALSSLRLEWPAQELVFAAAAGGPHQLLVGYASARAPAYDLPAVLARTPDVRTAPATLGPLGPNPAYRPAEALVPFTERHRGPLGAVLLALLVGLGLFALRLLRAPAGSGHDPPGPGSS